jgi:hypothetical protein
MSNELALAWLKHFDAHTKPVRAWRLLIINGYESYCSLEFQEYCKENKIIALCMPPYSSHLLQPLNVTCFSPLKRSYSDSISALARNYIHYISKETFLLAFKAAYELTFTKQNARAGFKGARLVLFNLEAVLLKLNMRLRTLTLLQRDDVAWEAKTPRNAKELEA